METISDRIKKIRGNKTQVEFAELLKLKHQYISRYEKGTNPSTEFLKALSDILSVNINWLLTGEGEPYSTAKPEVRLLEENILLKDENSELKKSIEHIQYITKSQLSAMAKIDKTFKMKKK